MYCGDGGGGVGSGVGRRTHRFHLLKRKVSLGGVGAETEVSGFSSLMPSPKPSEALQPVQWTVRFLLDTLSSVLDSRFYIAPVN